MESKTIKSFTLNEKEIKDVRRGFFSTMWYYHKFFVKETPSFIGKLGQKWRVRKTWTTEIHEQYYPLTIGQKLRYPFVYVKFMWMCAKDWYYWRVAEVQNNSEDSMTQNCLLNLLLAIICMVLGVFGAISHNWSAMLGWFVASLWIFKFKNR